MTCEIKQYDHLAHQRLPAYSMGGFSPAVRNSATKLARNESAWYNPNGYTRKPSRWNQSEILYPLNPREQKLLEVYQSLLRQVRSSGEKNIRSFFIFGVGPGAIDYSAIIDEFGWDVSVFGTNLSWDEWDWLSEHAPHLYHHCDCRLVGGIRSLAVLDSKVKFDLISAVRGGVSGLNTRSPIFDKTTSKSLGVEDNHEALIEIFASRQETGAYLIADYFNSPMEKILSKTMRKENPSMRHFFKEEEIYCLLADNGYEAKRIVPYSQTNLLEANFGQPCSDQERNTHWLVLAQRNEVVVSGHPLPTSCSKFLTPFEQLKLDPFIW